MKNKQVAFFGFIAALLWGTASHAAQITSKAYVDAKDDAVLQTVTSNYSTTEQVQTIVDSKGVEVLETVDTKLGGYYNKTEVDDKVADVVTGDMSEALKGYAKTVDVNTGLDTKANQATIGTMGALTTSAKDTIVNAINEVKSDSTSAINSAATAISTAQSAETVAGEAKDAADKNAGVIATKANQATVGIMGALTTSAKDTIVNAINEVKSDSTSAIDSAAIAISTAQSAETVAGEAKDAADKNAGVIATKANSADVYTKTEVNTELDKKLDVAALDNYVTTDELTSGLDEKASLDSLNLKEDISNKSNNIAADSGSVEKYTSVNSVQIYALPKPSAGCLAESAQCVLAINKSTGVVYWENVVTEVN